MALKLITPPAALPVSLVEAKAHLRVDHADDDALIAALIQAATGHLDGWNGILGRALVTQIWDLIFDEFPSEGFRIPLGPVSAVNSVIYVDANSVEQTIAAENYEVDLVSSDAWVLPASAYSWPTPLDATNVVRVRYTAGYGDAAAVPAPIKAAILLMVGGMYQNRETHMPSGFQINTTVDALIVPYRRLSL